MIRPVLRHLQSFLPGALVNKVNLAYHQGNKFNCPFCNYSSSGLATIGTNSTANREKHIIGAGLRKAGCYKCGSTDRERLVYLYLRDVVELFSKNKSYSVLHIAPEKNLINLLRKADVNYIAGERWVDKHDYYKGIEQIDILDISYTDNYFDLIICNHVLEHIPDDQRAMRELYRVLKPGGQAILQVPLSEMIGQTFEDFSITGEKEREEIFGQQDHVRIYGRDYTDRLASSGFGVRRINLALNSVYDRNGLNPEEVLFIGYKTI